MGERTNQDTIKVAIIDRGVGQCYLTISPPGKMMAKGWVSFERGPFPPSQIQQELDKQAPTLQHMICELLGCEANELEGKCSSAIEFSRHEAAHVSLSSASKAAHSAA